MQQPTEVSRWLCFVDQYTGLHYKSRLAATRSETELSQRSASHNGDAEMINELSATAHHLDLARIKVRTLLTHLCTQHRNDDNVTGLATFIESKQLNHDKPCVKNHVASNTDVLVINLDDSMFPMVVTACACSENTDRSTRQDYLDDLRRREEYFVRLETQRLALQENRRRPLVFVFAYGREASVRTCRDLARNGCTYSETPVFVCTEDLLQHLESLLQ